MSWWRRQPEVRGEDGYTSTRLHEQFTQAISGNVRHGALGGLQCAAGAVARAFAAAEVEGDEGLLDPTTLYQMGYDLVTEGQTLWLLDGGTGRLRLSRAAPGTGVYEGAAAADSWTYQVTLPGPSITTDRPGVGRPSDPHSTKQRPDVPLARPVRARGGAVERRPGGEPRTCAHGRGGSPRLAHYSAAAGRTLRPRQTVSVTPSQQGCGWPCRKQ